MSTLTADRLPISDRFRVHRQLGAGRTGAVYQVFDRERGVHVALKTLERLDAAGLRGAKIMLEQLAAIDHPNVSVPRELFLDQRPAFVCFDLLHGIALNAWVRPPPLGLDDGAAAAQLDMPRLRRALSQVADGLAALHQIGLAHGALKPSNVLVTEAGRPVLLDAGLSRFVQLRSTTEQVLADAVGYLSPEQAGGHLPDARSDWYALGVFLYEALTGQVPFAGASPAQILRAKQDWVPSAPTTLNPDVPSSLAQLALALLSREPEARPGLDEVLGELGPPQPVVWHPPPPEDAAPFVGRERQTARLFAAYEVVRMGRAVAVYVSGPSGIGKTALVQHFLAELAADGEALILAGRCYERESVPYKALDSLIEGLSCYLGALSKEEARVLLPEDIHVLARVFPVLHDVEAVREAPAPKEDTPDPAELRQLASNALRELLGRVSSRRSIVLHVDDLHWGDIDGGMLLVDLLRPPEAPPLLLIGSYRTEAAADSPIIRALLAHRAEDGPVTDVRDIELGPLPDKEAQQLAGLLFGDATVEGSQRVEAVARESGGNPYLACELVRHWSDQMAGGGATTGSISLDALLKARLSELPPPSKRLLEVIAVAGRPVRRQLASLAAGLGGASQAVFQELRVGLLIRSEGSAPQDRVEIYHGRIRDALLAQLPAARRAALHRRLAEALESSGEGDAETLLDYLIGAGELERASQCAASLARQAAEALAFEQAAELFRRALQLHDRDDRQVTAWQVELGEALVIAGRGAEAAQAFLQAAEGAPASVALELRRRAAEQLLRSGHVDDGLEYLEEVLSEVGLSLARGHRRAIARLLYRRFRLFLRGRKFTSTPESAIDARTLTRIDTCWSGAVGLGMVDTVLGAELQTRHLLLALRAGEPYRAARALAIEASYHASAGNRTRRRARVIIEQAAELAEASGHPHAEGLVMFGRGLIEFFDGRWPEAWRHCEAAEDHLRRRCAGATWEVNSSRIFAMGSLYYMGHIANLCDLVPRLLKDQEDRGDLFASASLRADVPNIIWLAADEPERARHEIDEVMAGWSSSGFHIQHYWRLLAETRVDLYEGRGAEAWERVRARWSALSKSFLLRVQIVRIFSVHLRARAALAASRRSSEPWTLLSVAKRDVKRLDRERLPMVSALARLVEAGILRAEGDLHGAERVLHQAIDELEACHMGLFASAARLRLGELISGEKGEELMATADRALKRQRIRQPERMVDMLAPGAFSVHRR